MSRTPRFAMGLLLAAPLLPALVASCSGNTPITTGGGPAAGAARATPAASASASASSTVPVRQFQPEDFSEAEQSRDPFRSYVATFAEVVRARVHTERKVLISRYSVDELRLVALVTRTDVPRAMLVDPTGRGWVVSKGQFIGRAEVVHAGGPGGVDYELNWRVDRVRETDIVLIREDSAHPDVTPATRVIALRTEKPETAEELQIR